jgi:hypothetical protein
MIWLSWRQFRAQAVTAAAALVVFAILLAVTGPHLASLYAASGIGGCQGSSCDRLATGFVGQLEANGPYPALYVVSIAVIILTPAVIGVFWGAPLIARELETGTFRLAWTQSVSRARWLAVKLGVAGLAAMAVTEGLSLMQAWWAAPLGRAAGYGASGSLLDASRFTPVVFASHGITPLGYAAFAFILGATIGVLVRRAVPAMAVTLAVFAAIQLAVPLWVRPHLFPPDHVAAPLSSVQISLVGVTSPDGHLTVTAGDVPGQPGAWILASGPVNSAGQPVSTPPAACAPGRGVNLIPLPGCLARLGFREAISYQPASRFWALQWIETGIYLILALALAWYCFWLLSPGGRVRPGRAGAG